MLFFNPICQNIITGILQQRVWCPGVAGKSERMHYDGIYVSKSKACTAMVFETIWNCREHFENNVSKECILTVF